MKTQEKSGVRATWAEVRTAALTANLRALQKELGHADLLAVVKADAYGHGAALCAKALVGAGVKWLGVTGASEGALVREAIAQEAGGAEARILLMRGVLPGEGQAVMDAHLTPVVWTLEQLDEMERAAKMQGVQAAAHLEVDTGMSRQGVGREGLSAMLARFKGSQMLRLEGVLTHFAAAEDEGSTQNAEQMKALAGALEQVRAAGLKPQWVHAGSTSTVDAGVELPGLAALAACVGARLMCRTGLGLYGYALELSGASARVREGLQPVLAWKTRVLSVYEVAAGARIGYNGTVTAERPMRLALLAVGYADGLRRELSRGGEVLIAGKRARMVGRVSMDATIVDVSGISEVKAGDEAVLIGEQGVERITADDQARVAGTIAYEILCGIGARVPRYCE